MKFGNLLLLLLLFIRFIHLIHLFHLFINICYYLGAVPDKAEGGSSKMSTTPKSSRKPRKRRTLVMADEEIQNSNLASKESTEGYENVIQELLLMAKGQLDEPPKSAGKQQKQRRKKGADKQDKSYNSPLKCKSNSPLAKQKKNISPFRGSPKLFKSRPPPYSRKAISYRHTLPAVEIRSAATTERVVLSERKAVVSSQVDPCERKAAVSSQVDPSEMEAVVPFDVKTATSSKLEAIVSSQEDPSEMEDVVPFDVKTATSSELEAVVSSQGDPSELEDGELEDAECGSMLQSSQESTKKEESCVEVQCIEDVFVSNSAAHRKEVSSPDILASVTPIKQRVIAAEKLSSSMKKSLNTTKLNNNVDHQSALTSLPQFNHGISLLMMNSGCKPCENDVPGQSETNPIELRLSESDESLKSANDHCELTKTSQSNKKVAKRKAQRADTELSSSLNYERIIPCSATDKTHSNSAVNEDEPIVRRQIVLSAFRARAKKRLRTEDIDVFSQ